VGWFGYGIGVFVVVTAAAWLAVRGGASEVPEPASGVTVVEPVIALPDSTTTTPSVSVPTTTPSISATTEAPVVDPGIPTATSTTTAPLLSAAATPAPTP